MSALITESDLRDAAIQLSKSRKGRTAMKDLLAFLDNEALGLDQDNKLAVLTLLEGAFSAFPGTARDEMRAALGE